MSPDTVLSILRLSPDSHCTIAILLPVPLFEKIDYHMALGEKWFKADICISYSILSNSITSL